MFTDLRHALRALTHNPGFTTIAVLTLALGIGANAAIFSVVNSVLLRPLRFADPERIVEISTKAPDEARSNHSAGDFLDIQRENRSLSAAAGYTNSLFTIAKPDQADPIQLPGAFVTNDFFDVLRAPTLIGRTFSRADGASANARAVVLSRTARQQLFGESSAAVGATIRINGEPRTVLGVLAAHAAWPQTADVWVLSDKAVPPSPIDNRTPEADREVGYIEAIGRLAPGVSLEQARSDLVRLSAVLRERNSDRNGSRVLQATPIREQLVGDVRFALMVLQGAVGLVLLIACANVSSLLIARGTARAHEVAIRSALGAGRWRLIRHLLAESLVLGAIGGIAGLILGAWLVGILVKILPEGIPRTGEIALDRTVGAVSMIAALATGLLFGLMPAVQTSRTDAGSALKASGGRGSSARARARSVLVVAEIALTLVLLVSAGLLINSFLHLQRTDSGLQREHVTVMSLALPQPRYPTGASQVRLYRQIIDGLAARPEVQFAGVGFPGPLRGSNATGHFYIEDRPVPAGAAQPFANISAVSAGYLQAMGIPIVTGRAFTDADGESAAGVAIVSVALARKYWPGENAIGKRVRFEDDKPEWITVVGIAGDVRQLGLDKEPPALLYVPYQQLPLPFTNVAIRSRVPDQAIAQVMRNQIAALDSLLPAGDMDSLDTIINRSIEEPRFRGLLLGAFACMALILAAVGVYGLISYSVTQRRREIGIRVALGAQPHQVLVPVVREGLALALTGMAIGLAGSFIAARVLGRFLFGVGAGDPVTLISVSAVLLTVAFLATYIPSRRALRIDPVVALRSE
jgi:putative ABC transport system permease protein